MYRLGLLSPHNSGAEQLRQRLCDPENLTRAISGPSPTKSADPGWVPVARPGAEAASSTAIHNLPSEPLSALASALPCGPAPVSLGRPLGAQAPADSGWEVRAPRPVLPMLSPLPGAVRPTDGAGVGRRARAAEPVHRPPEPAGGGRGRNRPGRPAGTALEERPGGHTKGTLFRSCHSRWALSKVLLPIHVPGWLGFAPRGGSVWTGTPGSTTWGGGWEKSRPLPRQRG